MYATVSVSFCRSFTLSIFIFASWSAQASNDWLAVTIDNDFFVGDDSGYTNGFVVSVFDAGESGEQPDPGVLLAPLRWSIDADNAVQNINGYALGQLMVTPSQTDTRTVSDDDVPYSGLLFVTNVHLAVNADYADVIGTTIGVVGPASGARQTQTFFHHLIGNSEPKGWDNQLGNELVFQFERGRIWRLWASTSDTRDVVAGVDGKLGTLSSELGVGMVARYGKGLQNTYAAPILASGRIVNPIAIDGGWFVFAGLNGSYTFNQIFTDGNTFKDSPSVDYDHVQLGGSIGLAYSWQDVSVTFALSDLNMLESIDLEENKESLTRFGTLTFAWRL